MRMNEDVRFFYLRGLIFKINKYLLEGNYRAVSRMLYNTMLAMKDNDTFVLDMKKQGIDPTLFYRTLRDGGENISLKSFYKVLQFLDLQLYITPYKSGIAGYVSEEENRILRDLI